MIYHLHSARSGQALFNTDEDFVVNLLASNTDDQWVLYPNDHLRLGRLKLDGKSVEITEEEAMRIIARSKEQVMGPYIHEWDDGRRLGLYWRREMENQHLASRFDGGWVHPTNIGLIEGGSIRDITEEEAAMILFQCKG